MRISVFVGVSIDGFIAHEDGGLGFLDPFGDVDHGYDEFFRSIDAVVVGRNTYDTVLAFPTWPYEGKEVVVLTHRPLDARHGESVHAGDLRPLASRLASAGVQRVYLDGGVAIRQGLDENLVDDMTISTVPVTIGAGRSLLGGAPRATGWTLTAFRGYPNGLVQARYERVRA